MTREKSNEMLMQEDLPVMIVRLWGMGWREKDLA